MTTCFYTLSNAQILSYLEPSITEGTNWCSQECDRQTYCHPIQRATH